MPGIGVYICDCKGQVSDRVDTARLADLAGTLEGVVFVERKDLLCGEKDLGAGVSKGEILRFAQDDGLVTRLRLRFSRLLDSSTPRLLDSSTSRLTRPWENRMRSIPR